MHRTPGAQGGPRGGRGRPRPHRPGPRGPRGEHHVAVGSGPRAARRDASASRAGSTDPGPGPGAPCPRRPRCRRLGARSTCCAMSSPTPYSWIPTGHTCSTVARRPTTGGWSSVPSCRTATSSWCVASASIPPGVPWARTGPHVSRPWWCWNVFRTCRTGSSPFRSRASRVTSSRPGRREEERPPSCGPYSRNSESWTVRVGLRQLPQSARSGRRAVAAGGGRPAPPSRGARRGVDDIRCQLERYGLLKRPGALRRGVVRGDVPHVPVDEIALLRLDGDISHSTMVAFESLEPRAPPRHDHHRRLRRHRAVSLGGARIPGLPEHQGADRAGQVDGRVLSKGVNGDPPVTARGGRRPRRGGHSGAARGCPRGAG